MGVTGWEQREQAYREYSHRQSNLAGALRLRETLGILKLKLQKNINRIDLLILFLIIIPAGSMHHEGYFVSIFYSNLG